MSFPRYPRYKESGVEWLGEAPEHWIKGKLGHLLKSYPCYGVLVPDFEQDGVPMLRITDMENGNANRATLNTISHSLSDQFSKSIVEEGDVVISVVGTIGESFRVNAILAGVNLSRAVARLRLKISLEAKFLCWVFQTLQFRRFVDLVCTGTAQRVLNMDDLTAFILINPPLDEQVRIATFLDRETAKIDGLVAEQQRLIDLLKEKRQAVISHAVTKSLNPAAPMKPSGIEWLGDVPAHWKVGKCGFYLSILSGFAFPSAGFTEDESATKLLRGINVGVSRLKWDETVYWHRSPGDRLDIYEMRSGDVVMGMDRPLISEGMRAAMVKDCDLPCLLLQRVTSLKVGNHLHADYLLALISSEMFVAHFLPDTTGVSVPHISPDQINNFIIPVPPLSEQEFIVDLINDETTKFDTLTTEAQHAIDLLHERRTALISAAVTGQIDVRHLAEAGAA